MLPVLASLVLAVVTLTPARSPLLPEYPHVRASNPRVARLIEDAVGRSATFAGLYRRLHETDVILFVELCADLKPTLAGRLKFVSATPLVRYLQADIRIDLPRHDLVATIAHEMQHALEIAEAWEVRDRHGVDRLYRRIGQSPGGHSFDTDVARRVAVRVRAEMLA